MMNIPVYFFSSFYIQNGFKIFPVIRLNIYSTFQNKKEVLFRVVCKPKVQKVIKKTGPSA